MLYDDTLNDDTTPEEEMDDEDATLADDVLDEVDGKDIEEDEDDTLTEEEDVEESEEDSLLGNDSLEDDELDTLEEDAEEVDFDSFDDLDDM